MTKKVIAIVAGGNSSECEVSLRSAAGLNSFIDSDKYIKYIVTIVGKTWQVELPDGRQLPIDKNDFSFLLDNKKITFDFAYITIHGTPGENGILQGYFRLIGLPFSCCDVLQAALTFDKYACNNYLKSFGFKVAESIVLRPGETIDNTTVANKMGFPCFIKPSVGGSSFGVTKVKTIDQIQPAIAKAFAEGDEVMIEAFLSGTEVTSGMYKTKTKSVIFPITEVVTTNEFFDYDAKYNGQVDEITPARLSNELTQAIKNTTERIYTILHAKGIIRVDYIISPDGTINLLEVNTTPGMTATSFIPQQIRAAGLDIKDIMTDIIENELN
ncbi:MAG TPA: D-alanine--D-alanine ligase [Paludibacteraceae bacterium]|nr:D-alanine--D-alanine ligase [Paludibacteraceae bacterium]HQB68831.1 D-alanine--D-alanine ligase [Paludibacteraceae bacterium]HRS67494.1 D-alanine--D-alanine ligase [Paludibacteraceae bacterium]